MANGNGNTGVAAGIGISNTALAIGGTVALALIGGHLILGLTHKTRRHHWGPHPKHIPAITHHHIHDAIYEECLANASHPHTVHNNKDRIRASIQSRAPHINDMIKKTHAKKMHPSRMAEGIQNMAEDILMEHGIAQKPHPSAANPRLVQLFKNQRREGINYRYAVPGALMLDSAERQYLDHDTMALAGEFGHSGHDDHVGHFVGREHDRARFYGDRLRFYFGEHAARRLFREERALASILPPWLGGNIWPVAPQYPVYPTYGPDFLHPNLYPGYNPPLLLPFEGFPPYHGWGHHDRDHH